ncbi:heterokaryon incompatibility protein-domain-containing protein [Mariannaea sp. PMI_226]|nr:heterokaryon incompatibility protein-domain-containing protein [Mariannaea sp. PMI_226]
MRNLTGINTAPASKLPEWTSLSAVSTFDDNALAVKSWLQECRSLHAHTACHPVSFTPRRLLTVGLDGKPIRLVDGHTVTDQLGYATLSYCWGDSLQLQTRKDTLAQFSNAIQLEMFPKTFSDAVSITRAVGIPRIWIDALCIVQDDEEEWQSESANMGDIFQASQMTITAAQSVNSTQGCFPSANGQRDETELFFRAKRNGQQIVSYLVRVYHGDIWDRYFSNSTISQRGWVLQEQLLSRRVVSCTQSGVRWQCRTCYQTQSGLVFEPKDMQSIDFRVRTPSLHPNLHQNYRWCRATWQLIVKNYSNRRFTYEKDRVPAIAGITKYFAAALDDTPLLGLWKRSFIEDLAWLRLSRPERSSPSGLPSWSWISCPAHVEYGFWDSDGSSDADFDRKRVEHAKMLSWDIEWHGTPHTSPVKMSQVQLEGPVREIGIIPFAEGNASNPPYFKVSGDSPRDHVKTKIPWRCCGQFDAGETNTASVYLCLLLYSETKQVDGERTDEIFLILEPVQLQDGLKYRRLALAKIWGEIPTFEPDRTMSICLI